MCSDVHAEIGTRITCMGFNILSLGFVLNLKRLWEGKERKDTKVEIMLVVLEFSVLDVAFSLSNHLDQSNNPANPSGFGGR